MKIANMTTVARPYAIAAFEYALAANALPAWEAMLNAAAYVAEDPAVGRLLTNPQMTAKKLGELFCDVLASMLDTEKTNFIQLVAMNQRLAAIPAMAELFKTYREAQEKMLTVEVTSAVALAEPFKRKLSEALAKRLSRQITLTCEVNTDLLGGAIIRAGGGR